MDPGPRVDPVSVVDWEYLLTAMGILLGVSGARDIGLKERKTQDVERNNNNLE